MALGPKAMGEAIIRNLKEKTGKNLNQWVEIIKDSQLSDKKSIMDSLKKEHGLGHFQAQKIYEQFQGEDMYENVDEFTDQLFDKPILKELYNQVEQFIKTIDNNVRIQPCKTYIPFYRKNQFAIVKPKGDNVVIGLNLPDNFVDSRFQKAKTSASERINFQTTIAGSDQLDAHLKSIVQQAYKQN
ncbi:MAG: DUF5655 domain-containing protein [Bacteroidota bacterium]